MKIENETEKKINQESVAITSQVCGWRLLRICTFPVCVCKTENLMVKLIIYVFFSYMPQQVFINTSYIRNKS